MMIQIFRPLQTLVVTVEEEEDDCDLYIRSVVDSEVNIYHRRLCLLCPDSTVDLRNLHGRSVDDHRMDHSRTVSWVSQFLELNWCVMIAFV